MLENFSMHFNDRSSLSIKKHYNIDKVQQNEIDKILATYFVGNCIVRRGGENIRDIGLVVCAAPSHNSAHLP